MNKNIMTYALLAHINDGLGEIKDLSEVFRPLIMHCLSIYFQEGKRHGTIKDIQLIIKREYALDMPIDFLKKQLIIMETELSEKYGFNINSETISCKKFKFDNFSEVMINKNYELERIEQGFQEFIETNGYKVNGNSIYSFIDHNREQFLNLLTEKKVGQVSKHYTSHVFYIKSLQNEPKKMDCLREVFLGSLISCYFEHNNNNSMDNQIELVLDSNFIISLLRLHPEESSDLCHRVFKLASNQGYKFTVLIQTINEVKTLLNNTSEKIRSINSKPTGLSDIYDNDITNFCYQNEITPTELIRISSNLEKILEDKFPLIDYCDAKFLEEKAKNDNRYKRNIENQSRYREKGGKAILHDMLAILYVESKRKKRIRKINDANCWFLQSSNRDNHKMYKANGDVYEKIPSYFLLNTLWLSNPSADGEALKFAGDCLTRMLSLTINQIKPSRATIRIIEETVIRNKDKFTDKDLDNLKRIVVSESELLRGANDNSDENEILEVTKCAIIDFSTAEKKRSIVLKNAIADKDKAENDLREKAEKLTIEKTNEENKKDIYKEKFNISESLRYLNPQIADAEEKKSKMERNIKIRVLRNQFFCLCGIIICVVSTNRVVSDNWDLLEPKIWLGGILITMITKFISVKVLANYFDANHIINDPNSKYYKKYSKKYNYCRTEHGNLKMTYAESEELLEKLDG